MWCRRSGVTGVEKNMRWLAVVQANTAFLGKES